MKTSSSNVARTEAPSFVKRLVPAFRLQLFSLREELRRPANCLRGLNYAGRIYYHLNCHVIVEWSRQPLRMDQRPAPDLMALEFHAVYLDRLLTSDDAAQSKRRAPARTAE